MPISFESIGEFKEKIKEFIMLNANDKRFNEDLIAAHDIPYVFVEKDSWRSIVRFLVPKAFKKDLQKNAMMSVAIASKEGHGYVGHGVI